MDGMAYAMAATRVDIENYKYKKTPTFPSSRDCRCDLPPKDLVHS